MEEVEDAADGTAFASSSLTWELASNSFRDESDWGYFVDLTPKSSVEASNFIEHARGRHPQRHSQRHRHRARKGRTSRPHDDADADADEHTDADRKENSELELFKHLCSGSASAGTSSSGRSNTCESGGVSSLAASVSGEFDDSAAGSKGSMTRLRTLASATRLSSDLLFKEPSDAALDVLDDSTNIRATRHPQHTADGMPAWAASPPAPARAPAPAPAPAPARAAAPAPAPPRVPQAVASGLDTLDEAEPVPDTRPRGLSVSSPRAIGPCSASQSVRSRSSTASATPEDVAAEIAAAIARELDESHSTEADDSGSETDGVGGGAQRSKSYSGSSTCGEHFSIPKVKQLSDGTVKYLVTWHEPGQQVRRKWTRFSSFHALKDKIKLALPRDVAARFPKRKWKLFVNHKRKHFVEKRRTALETWLQQAADFLTAGTSSDHNLYQQHFHHFMTWLGKFTAVSLEPLLHALLVCRLRKIAEAHARPFRFVFCFCCSGTPRLKVDAFSSTWMNEHPNYPVTSICHDTLVSSTAPASRCLHQRNEPAATRETRNADHPSSPRSKIKQSPMQTKVTISGIHPCIGNVCAAMCEVIFIYSTLHRYYLTRCRGSLLMMDALEGVAPVEWRSQQSVVVVRALEVVLDQVVRHKADAHRLTCNSEAKRERPGQIEVGASPGDFT